MPLAKIAKWAVATPLIEAPAPDPRLADRLVGMVFGEQNDEWIEARRSVNVDAVQQRRPALATAQLVEPAKLATEAV